MVSKHFNGSINDTSQAVSHGHDLQVRTALAREHLAAFNVITDLRTGGGGGGAREESSSPPPLEKTGAYVLIFPSPTIIIVVAAVVVLVEKIQADQDPPPVLPRCALLPHVACICHCGRTVCSRLGS